MALLFLNLALLLTTGGCVSLKKAAVKTALTVNGKYCNLVFKPRLLYSYKIKANHTVVINRDKIKVNVRKNRCPAVL